LTNEAHILPLNDAVRQAIFEDAANTAANPCLVGPPNVEFAPFGRIPGGRRRVDARSGTIDQDPDFMAFLEALANPLSAKDTNAEGVAKDPSSVKAEKVTTTPLVQYLKDKKASRKETVVKGGKKQEATAKGKGGKESSSSPEDSRKKGKDAKGDRAVDRAAKEAVKILNREASNKVSTSATNASKSGSATTAQQTPPKLDLAKVSGRQRGPAIAAHIKMLQRDLGLTTAQAHRQVRRDTADAQKAEKEAAVEKGEAPKPVEPPVPSQSPIPTAPKSILPPQNAARGPRNRGQAARTETSKQTTPSAPMVLLKKPEASSSSSTTTPIASPAKSTQALASRRGPIAATPSSGSTQAFVKHANPSQGVTETLLKEALEKFGAVNFVEIDKRKGFAYVDFVDTEGLKKAMAANPIAVAQGTVHVAQRKGAAPPPQAPVQQIVQEKKPAPQIPIAPANRGGRGGHGRGGTIGRRGGRGGGGRGGTAPGSSVPAVPTGPSGK